MTENQSSSTSLVLFRKRLNNFNPKELWNKCYLMSVISKNIFYSNKEEELEKRIMEFKNLRITLEIRTLIPSGVDLKKLTLESADGTRTLTLHDNELNSIGNFEVESDLALKALKLFDLFSGRIKKIKRLEKILINEVNQYEQQLKDATI